MKKYLTNKVDGYLTETGKLCVPGKAIEFTGDEWKAIPEKDKPLFMDTDPALEKTNVVKEAKGNG